MSITNTDIYVVDNPTPIKTAKPAQPVITPEDYEPPVFSETDYQKDKNLKTLPALRLDVPLPLNILSERAQCRVLGWESETVKVVNHQTGIFNDLPMICEGTDGCPFGKICPVQNRDDFKGKSCPLEIREIFKNFSGYVRDLDIQPNNFADLKLVAKLCRHHITLWRCDMALKTQPEVVKEVAVVAQKTGDVYYRDSINKHRELQAIAEEQILKIYKELVATRDARSKNQENSNAQSISVLMSRISGISTKADKKD